MPLCGSRSTVKRTFSRRIACVSLVPIAVLWLVSCLFVFILLPRLFSPITCASTGFKASRERPWVLRVFPDIPVNGAQLCAIALPLIAALACTMCVSPPPTPTLSPVLPFERAGTTPLPRRRSQLRTLRMPSTTVRFRLVPQGNRLLSFSTLDQATSGSVQLSRLPYTVEMRPPWCPPLVPQSAGGYVYAHN